MFLYFIRKMHWYWLARYYQKHGREEERRALVEKQVDLWVKRVCGHIKLNLIVEGAENLPKDDETVLFVANHQSYIDIPVLLGALGKPYGLMAKTAIGKVPLLRLWMDQLGCVYVKREDVRSSITAMKEGEERLRNGHSMILFPEGTRSIAEPIAEFKAGGIHMAKKAGVPVVPVMIDGSYLVLEGNGYKLQPVDVRVVILPKIETNDMDRAAFKALPETLRELIWETKQNRPPGLKPPRAPVEE